MKKTGIFYATKSGSTEEFAEQIAKLLGAECLNMADTDVEAIGAFDNVVLMSAHYGFGYLTDDWAGKVKLLNTVDWSGKKVALVGVGSQERHPDSFCSGLQDFVLKIGNRATFVGQVDASDYSFEFSRAQDGNKMLGLCLDKGDDEEKNDQRIAAWVENVKKAFA